MNFIYFVDLTDPLVCYNIINTNQLISPSIIHLDTFKEIYPLYTISPDLILNNLESVSIGFISPRLKIVTLSNWARNGIKIGIGNYYYSQEEIDRFHRIAELEIEFEKIRRQINKNHPSRLSCIFLAEDNQDGRTMLKNMFPYKLNFHIVNISITLSTQFHKADSKWIDNYIETNNTTSIINYWKGIPFDNFPEYEYLLEGKIELVNKSDQNFIETNFDTSKYA
ncbi:hypothetical protein [Flavobacterium quisquiliarum]|uniref:Uncharacterized protein n=1 Tax=Flavobacterium quisquiliarum TaxID=1834436 RepID=A0ABV8W629_9FLAO|nr:hypothetical protein [Flavobacterium quisquiliarum]MBW1656484.1 hypothetical protein [Flavobacterium quisquiliarum]NWL03847.1 hypothetical protein [Flavobacterium collinsii]